MAFERPRGVRDFGPSEMGVRTYVEDRVLGCFNSYGYRRIETPTFEFIELFEMKSGEDIRDHLYVFEDKGGRRLCLRPESTAQVARMYTSELRNLPKPLRVCYLGNMFRYEEPQKGRYREFWQAGVELIGVGGPEADAEAICLTGDCLNSLGLRHTIRVSHIGVLRELLGNLGLGDDEQDKLIQKLDKGDYEYVKGAVKDKKFLGILGLKGGSAVVDKAVALVGDGRTKDLLLELKKTLTLLDLAGIRYEVDFSMARGLDYYTGMVYDVRVDGLGAQNQVCGGGRYDNLIELFGGPPTPAVGFAFGLDRLVESVQHQGIKVPQAGIDVLVIPVCDGTKDAAFKVAADLRRKLAGRNVEYDLSGRKLNKALQHASEMGVRYAEIVGEEEVKEGAVMLKDLTTHKQDKVKMGELSSHIN